MKRVFGPGGIHLLPLPGGFAFAAQQTIDDQLVVAYNIYSIDKGKVSPITRSIYLMAKLGQEYEKYAAGIHDHVNSMAVTLPDGSLLLAHPDGAAKVIDDTGRTLWKGAFVYRDKGPADLLVMGRSLWGSFPESNCLLRYSLRGMREDLRLGGSQPSFSEPFGLWRMDECNMLVCNRKSRTIKQVNALSYTVNDYAEFEEPVLQYIKIGAHEFALLKSGIYRL